MQMGMHFDRLKAVFSVLSTPANCVESVRSTRQLRYDLTSDLELGKGPELAELET